MPSLKAIDPPHATNPLSPSNGLFLLPLDYKLATNTLLSDGHIQLTGIHPHLLPRQDALTEYSLLLVQDILSSQPAPNCWAVLESLIVDNSMILAQGILAGNATPVSDSCI
jgi:hypothetical protein